MLEFLNSVRRGPAEPLSNVTAADHFWQLLPRDDPFAAQRAVSDALDDIVSRERLDLGQFRALLALDQLARSLGDALLIDYATSGARSSSLKANSWQSAFLLCRSLGQAFDYALRQVLEDKPGRGWREHVTTVLLRLFQHRQIEFLLQPFTGEHSIPDCWIGLHRAFRYAEAAGALGRPLVARRCHDGRGEESTLEREYLHVLLLQRLNGGHLSPYEAFWMNRQMPRWCAGLSLRADPAPAPVEQADRRFVVDLESAAGLARPSRSPAGTLRYLDPAPMLALIRDEIAALRDPARPPERDSPLRPGRQLKLLNRISTDCRPSPVPVNRRGERLPIVSTVEAVVGLSHITRMLGHESQRKRMAAQSALPGDDAEAGESAGAGSAASPPGTQPGGAERAAETAGEFLGPDHVWQLKDRSESGCRLRGRIGSSNRVLPGALVALREHAGMPWKLAVVRRVRKRIGDRIDMGVEFVGQNPLAVNLAAEDDRTTHSNAASERRRGHCIALHLRESFEPPHMPFKTLIISPREFKAGRCLRLRSEGADYTVRLKEPIEEQDGFVWLPYEVVFRRVTDGEDRSRRHRGERPIAAQPDRPAVAARSAVTATSTVRDPAPRVGRAGKT